MNFEECECANAMWPRLEIPIIIYNNEEERPNNMGQPHDWDGQMMPLYVAALTKDFQVFKKPKVSHQGGIDYANIGRVAGGKSAQGEIN